MATQNRRTARVNVPVLREVLEKLGSEKGTVLVGECYDLVSGALMDAIDNLSINPFVKGAARGPIEMVMGVGRTAVLEWAQKQLPSTKPPPRS